MGLKLYQNSHSLNKMLKILSCNFWDSWEDVEKNSCFILATHSSSYFVLLEAHIERLHLKTFCRVKQRPLAAKTWCHVIKFVLKKIIIQLLF